MATPTVHMTVAQRGRIPADDKAAVDDFLLLLAVLEQRHSQMCRLSQVVLGASHQMTVVAETRLRSLRSSKAVLMLAVAVAAHTVSHNNFHRPNFTQV